MPTSESNYCLSIAPMLDWTDRHFRYFIRLISRHTRLYTEMVTTAALLRGDAERLLAYDPSEHPLAIQLGGSEPGELAQCARLAEAAGYDEVNLNLGCPSNRVQHGRFGACLMAEPLQVADCVRAMKQTVEIPVTLKTRIGIDERDSYRELCRFIEAQIDAGCDYFIIHARKAWLQGLSPKENREVPPLRYDLVKRLKRDHPDQGFSLNGGIQSLAQAVAQLQVFDGVMIGRAVYHDPYLLAEADRLIFDDPHPVPNRHQILERFLPYVEQERQRGVALKHLTRHILGLFHGCPGARGWRRLISEQAHQAGAGPELIRRAAGHVRERETNLT